ncbi:MAG TPA: hypothetical protein VH137_03190, partial [Gemmatimonadales bacterium]|nr:hypothetical protein [Gemmatimonadales bacterium]
MTVPRRTPDSGITEPLAGVQSSFVTVATRQVARRLRVERDDHTDPDISTSLLAAIALAVDGGHPEFVARFLPRPSVGLGERLVEMLRTELLKSWAEKTVTTSAAGVLDALTALEQVQQTLRRNLAAPQG